MGEGGGLTFATKENEEVGNGGREKLTCETRENEEIGKGGRDGDLPGLQDKRRRRGEETEGGRVHTSTTRQKKMKRQREGVPT